jgi:competence protein ComEC
VLVLTQDGGWSPLLPSTRVAARGRLGPPRPGDTVGAVLLARGPPRIIAGPSRHQRIAGALRARLRAAASVLPEPADGLFPALVVGDVSRLDPDLRADFRTAGMTHLTAVSGGNLAILCGVVLAALRRTRIGIRSRALWVAVVIIGFVVLARPSASVLRAAVMGLIGVLAVSSGRGSSVLPALAAAVGLLVLVQPGLALSAGFALSVLATGGIVVLGPGWRAALGRRLPDRLAEVVAVAAAAQLACTPVLAWIGGGISLVAIPANVAAVVAVPPITVLGVVALAVSPVSDPCARVVVWLAGWPCRWLVGVARIAADVPGGTLHWPDGPVGALVALAALPAALAALRRPRTRRLAAAATAGLLVARLVLAPRLAPWPPPGWRLVACDVGQGDALVLGAGDGSGVLVDAGPDPDAVRRCLDELRIRWLPLIVLTHLHADHVEGLAAVLGHRPVGTIVTTPLHEPAAQWSRVRGWARQADVPISDAAAGQTLTVGPLSLRVLGPVRVLHGTNSDPNNASVVLLARSGGLTMLLTGDAEGPEQRQVLGTGALGPTAGGRPGGGATAGGGAAGGGAVHLDVLKVAHHGSADQSPGMLAATGARVALISVGVGNDYGHPASSTLAALAAAGITVARTDRNGSAAVLPGPRGPLVVVRRPAG